jgi:PAS domain S-box-containing protein
MVDTKKTILLVEDEALIALGEKKDLEKCGYKVIISNTGEAAIKMAEEHHDIDLVLMDINLGSGMDGTEAAAAILEKKDIPIVFLSSHVEPEIVEKTEQITSYGYVVKASNLTVLNASIHMAFRLFEAHKAIYDRNQLLENIMEAFPGSVFWKDTNSVYLGCNTTEAICSGAASPKDVIGKTDYDLGWEGYGGDFYRNSDKVVLETGKPVLHIEESYPNGINGEVVYDTSKVPLFDNNGKISGIFGVSIDITERKRLEEKLIVSNEMLQKILDSIPQFIAWKDRKSVFLGCNKNYADMTGLPDTQSIMGKTDWDLPWKKEETEDFLKDDELVMSSDTPKYHIIEPAFDVEGKQRWLATNKVPLHDAKGNVYGILVAFSDITERWESEKTLIENEKFYHSVMDASPDGIAITDLSGEITTVSPIIPRSFGYVEEELIGHPITDFITEEDRDRAAANISYMFQGIKKGAAEYRGVKKNRGIVFIEVNAAIIRDIDEQPNSIVFIIRDITKTKMAARALKEEQALMNALMENSTEFIYFKDTQGKFIRTSKSHANYFGLDDPAKMVGKSDFDYYSGEFALKAQKDEQAIIGTGNPIRRIEEQVSEGRSINWILTEKKPLRDVDGNIMGIFGISKDITDEKRVQSALAEVERRFTRLFDSAPLGIFYATTAGHLISANPECARIFGYSSPDEIMQAVNSAAAGKAFFDMLGEWQELAEEAAKTGGTWMENEYDYRRKDGSHVMTELTFRVLPENPNIIEGFVDDISKRKDQEMKIEAMLEEKNMLLKEVHHRIKNNMNTIESLLSLQAGSIKDSSTIEALEEACGRVRSMMVLYDKLYRSPDFSSVSLRDYLPALVGEIVKNFPNSSMVNLKMDVEDMQLGPGILQPLGIMVNELLTNIMKYAFLGREEGIITISAFLRGGKVHIEIGDDGAGLPQGMDFTNSTGFGMNLVDSLTKQLNGDARIERGNGTKVILEFEK